jgi:hypothetical protein
VRLEEGLLCQEPSRIQLPCERVTKFGIPRSKLRLQVRAVFLDDGFDYGDRVESYELVAFRPNHKTEGFWFELRRGISK